MRPTGLGTDGDYYIVCEPAWQQAINAGRVKASFPAFLGGYRQESDYALARITFRNANQQELGELLLASIAELERQGVTGLLPVAADAYVPAETYTIVVNLTFTCLDGESNDGYADNVTLTRSEFGP